MRRLHLRFPQNAIFRPARQPFTVDPLGDWKHCTDTLPKDCAILGTITTEGVTGALVRLRDNGNFCKVVKGHVSVVNSIKVRQALNAYHEREIQGPLEMVSVDEFQE